MNKEINNSLNHLKDLEDKRAKLYKQLEISLALQSTYPDLFEYGPVKTFWRVNVKGEWTHLAPEHVWNDRKYPKQLLVDKGGIDEVTIPEKLVTPLITRPFKC